MDADQASKAAIKIYLWPEYALQLHVFSVFENVLVNPLLHLKLLRVTFLCEKRHTIIVSLIVISQAVLACVSDTLQIIGKTAGFAIPVLLVLLILVGFFAASSYDSGATSSLRP